MSEPSSSAAAGAAFCYGSCCRWNWRVHLRPAQSWIAVGASTMLALLLLEFWLILPKRNAANSNLRATGRSPQPPSNPSSLLPRLELVTSIATVPELDMSWTSVLPSFAAVTVYCKRGQAATNHSTCSELCTGATWLRRLREARGDHHGHLRNSKDHASAKNHPQHNCRRVGVPQRLRQPRTHTHTHNTEQPQQQQCSTERPHGHFHGHDYEHGHRWSDDSVSEPQEQPRASLAGAGAGSGGASPMHLPADGSVHTVCSPNVGREGHAFLSHIVSRYDSLAQVTFFAIGSLSLQHSKLDRFLHLTQLLQHAYLNGLWDRIRYLDLDSPTLARHPDADADANPCGPFEGGSPVLNAAWRLTCSTVSWIRDQTRASWYWLRLTLPTDECHFTLSNWVGSTDNTVAAAAVQLQQQPSSGHAPGSASSPSSSMSAGDVTPFGAWVEHYLDRSCDAVKRCGIEWEGLFAVSRSVIRRHPLSFYQRLMRTVSQHPSPEAGHFLERSWRTVFQC